jgi:hypothetical protein
MANNKKGGPADPDADGPASGSPEHTIAPDTAQPGDRSEMASNLGGPIDVFPGRGRSGGDQAAPGSAPANRTGPEKRKD